MTWKCPCNGCKKAVKQEQERIISEIEGIDISGDSQINALGFKILILEKIKLNK